MTFQSAPEMAEAVLNFSTSGKPMANVLNFWKPGGYVASDLQDLADAIDPIIDTYYLPLVSSGTNYDYVLVRGLEEENDSTRTNADSAGPGTASGSAVNSNASLCVTLRSDFTGRSARGRFFTMPTTVSNVPTADHYSSSYGNNVTAMLSNLQGAALTAGWTLVVLSRWHNNAKRAVAVKFVVTSISYRNLAMDSQRNRLPAGH